MGAAGSKDDVSQLASTTNFSKEELEEMQRQFKSRDTDNSGELNVAEFGELVKIKTPSATDATIAQMFRNFDQDGSGTVSFKELATQFSSMSTMTVEEKLSFMFDMYDADHSGSLTGAEVTSIVEQMTKASVSLGRRPAAAADFIQGIVSKLDVDGDHNITKAEWMSRGIATPSLLVLLNGGDY
eukprot:c38935_g1_i1.p1 GENE.c38935_g1_i1~~c38935_g1_i1.p1  ORF type:complete len:197 (+),score=57.60 c38935_g1_i1:42-593(+)